jgi:hypothetical protein
MEWFKTSPLEETGSRPDTMDHLIGAKVELVWVPRVSRTLLIGIPLENMPLLTTPRAEDHYVLHVSALC